MGMNRLHRTIHRTTVGIEGVYNIIEETRHHETEDGPFDAEMTYCYTPEGDPIGDVEMTEFICGTRGIKPRPRRDENIGKIVQCAIGFCEKEQKWYGWSHRAACGFGVGDSVEMGDCAYSPRDFDDFLRYMENFWSSDDYVNVVAVRGFDDDGREGADVTWRTSNKIPNKERRNQICGAFQVTPEKWGNGAWTAKTLEDAKTMAQDFAESVG